MTLTHTKPLSQPLGLALHTASPDLGLALGDFTATPRCQVWDLGRSLSTHLLVHLQDFLQPYTWADLDFLAIAIGPGGFTGTRMGVVTARTLAQQLGIPLYGISTLAAIAWATYQEPSQRELFEPAQRLATDMATDMATNMPIAEDIAVQLPAQRGAVHAAIYSLAAPTASREALSDQLTAQYADTVLPQEQWQHVLATWQRPYHLVQAEGGLGHTALSVLELAYQHWQQGDRPSWSTVLPIYGQSPVSP